MILIACSVIFIYRSQLPHQVTTPLRTLSTIGIADTVRFSPDGRTLAVVTEPNTEYQSSPMHYSIEIWDTATWQRKRIIPGGEFFLYFTPDSQSLLGMYDALKQWDVASGRITQDEEKLGFPEAISPDRKLVFTNQIINPKHVLMGTTASVWDTVKKRVRYQWKFPGSEAPYNDADFSPDSTILADVLSDHGKPEKTRLMFWDMKTGHTLSVPKALPSGVQAVAFSPDGKTFATGGVHQPLILWDKANGQQRTLAANFTQLLQIRFSKGGKWIFALGNSTERGSVIVWDTAAGREVLRDNGTQPIFSPDGQFLLTVDKKLTLWNLAMGRKSAFFGDDKPHFFPGFSPDDHLVAAPRERSTFVDIWAVPSP